jgi:hypothetical protein
MKRAVANAVEKRLDYGRLIESIAQLHDRAQSSAAAAVNRYLVLRNWLTGGYIVEFEQRGTDRARYGQRLLERLSADLIGRGIRGLSVTNLRQSRQFYRLYPQIRQTLSDELQHLRSQIHQTASDESPQATRAADELTAKSSPDLPPNSATLSRKSKVQQPTPLSPGLLLRLSWSHFIELIRVEDAWKRAFYENECLHGQWSVRQLQRQIGSLLFERTGLSKDKAGVIRRAHRQESPAPVMTSSATPGPGSC